MTSISEFCDMHNACDEGRKWATKNCETMQDVWGKAKLEWLVWVATRKGVLTEKEQRLFACWCVRQVWHLLMDERSKHAVEVAERFANGEATSEELAAARAAAYAADAARAAADAATNTTNVAADVAANATRAARAATDAAAYAAADAARATAYAAIAAADAAAYAAADAAADAAIAAASAAADAADVARAEYLRKLTPNFES